MTAVALIPSAGESRRMGFDKMRRMLAGMPLIVRTVRRLIDTRLFHEIIVAVPSGSEDDVMRMLETHGSGEGVRVIAGGETRAHSVWNALRAVSGAPDVVAIHDGARPFVSKDAVGKSLEAACELGGAVVAARVVPTIKIADEHDCVEATPDRKRLWAAATPQSFRYKEFAAAFERFWAVGGDPRSLTDDAQLFEASGGKVKLVEGNTENIKVTTPLDWRLAELLALDDPDVPSPTPHHPT